VNLKTPLALAAVVALAAVPMLGCETSRHNTIADNNAGLDVQASSDSIVAGETVTFIARSYDTYGRDAKIQWKSTAGDLKTEENGRVARVTFKEVGTYTVSATLTVDGRETARDMEEVRVRALN
jgi:plastocyanin